MLKNLVLSLMIFSIFNCNNSNSKIDNRGVQKDIITCNDGGCNGIYEGPEFENGSDVAHQFSNLMSEKVGEKLKELYQEKSFSRVNFDKIEMSTIGMKSDNVRYELSIPFVKVENKCDAFTSFDHVGGWNHTPALEERKNQLKKLLKDGQKLKISELKTTPEGLQEYWIQWKNKDLQENCDL